jgi:hypothetical protein
LIKAEVLVTTPRLSGRPVRPARTVWVWVGREAATTFVEEETFGSLGGRRVREAFIGRQLHETFRMQVRAGGRLLYDPLPVNGIIGLPQSQLRIAAFVDGREVQPRASPALNLAEPGDGQSSATVTVLAICDARVFRRKAVLSQKGSILSFGEIQFDFNRKGTIGWTAIDAQCPAPEGHVRLEAGPFYHSPLGSDRTRLAEWSTTYVAKRPPKKHPEEWEPVKP